MDREVFDALRKWAIEQCRFGQTPTKLVHEIVDALDEAGFVIVRKPPTDQRMAMPKIVADPTVPVGMMEFHYPDGRVERVSCNFP